MAVTETSEPIWFGRVDTRSRLLRFLGVHRVRGYNPFPEHQLPCYEVGVVETGRLSLLVAGRAVTLRGGQLVVIPPRTPLKSGPGTNDGLFYWIGLDPADAGARTEGCRAEETLDQLGEALASHAMTPQPAPPSLLEAAGRCMSVYSDPGTSSLLRRGAAWTLAGTVLHALGRTAPQRLADRQRIEPALVWIDEHLDQPLAIEELAARCDLSRTRFNELFRQVVGETPRTHVNRRKIDLACRMLAQPGRTVAAVAEELAFSSPQYFSSVFRKFRGMSPSEYRSRDV